jgi:hypothetical protein
VSRPATVYLHIGLHKTGTTYLQSLFLANRAALAEQGVEYPGGPDGPSQLFAVWDLHGVRPQGVEDRRIAGSWQTLVDHVQACGLPTALISDERLSISSKRQARKAVSAFAGSDVEVVVTVRDLARVAVSAWQEGVKKDWSWSWDEFAASIRYPSQVAVNPARGFWIAHDVVKVCELWETLVPAERIHIVTVPPRGSDPTTLLMRMANVVGFDPQRLTEQPTWDNASVGVAGTEVIRQVNARLGGRLNKRQHDRAISLTLAPLLGRRDEADRFGLPDDELPWVTERAEQMVAGISQRGYRVEGDLDDLLPRPDPGARHPGDAKDDELLAAALDGLALLSERYAKVWWARKQADVEDVDEAADVGSRVRSWGYAAQTRAGPLADNNALAAKVVQGAMAARDWWNTRVVRRRRG